MRKTMLRRKKNLRRKEFYHSVNDIQSRSVFRLIQARKTLSNPLIAIDELSTV